MAPLAHPGRGPNAPAWADGGLVQARVIAGDVSIPYVQGGEGRPVVLLGGAPRGVATSLLSWEALSRDYRVVAPVLERGGLVHVDGDSRVRVAFSRWLQDFLDGLGLAEVALVAEEPFGVPALAYALSDPDRVRRIALVFHDTHDPAGSDAAVRDGFARTGTSVLVVRVGAGHGGVGASSADLIRFLADAEKPTREGVAP